MPAHTFGLEWLDPLLRSGKQGTTRPQSTQIKVGDIVSVYNQQRRRIADKPLHRLTAVGERVMSERIHPPYSYPPFPHVWGVPGYYAHFLGKVEITEVYDMQPLQNSHRNAWARAEGFSNFTAADTWFTKRYGEAWADRWWTVERWAGWLERYFEPEAI